MKTNDLQVGQTYGRLTLLAKEDQDGKNTKGTHKRWTFQCVCGTVKVTRPYFVAKGRATSCGCYNREVVRRPKPTLRIEPGMAAAKQLWHGYRLGATKRRLSFDLTFEQFIQLTQKLCYYCNQEPSNQTKSISTRYNGQYHHNGIDRVDNNVGYVYDNCVACCKICNNAKKTLSLREFNEWIDRLVAVRSQIWSPK